MPQEPSTIPNTISRTQLTAILLAVPAIGLLIVAVLANRIQPRPELQLKASAKLEIAVWTPSDGNSSQQRLLPSVVIKNDSGEPWKNVAISLNKQFFHYHFKVLQPSETLTVPLEQFFTKGGNVHFRPASQTVELVEIFGQIPNGERGVFSQPVQSKDIIPQVR